MQALSPYTNLLRVCLAMVALAAAGGAGAQQLALEPSDAVNCLTPSPEQRSNLAYPAEALQNGRGGTVQVELTFHRPNAAPRVLVLAGSDDQEFVDAVRKHVDAFRVPCLRAEDSPARLKFTFVFRMADRKVASSSPADAADRDRRALLQCMRHLSGAKAPDYPVRALRRQVQGRVLALLRFTTADGPPETTILARPNATELADGVREFADGLRMPCLGSSPLNQSVTYIFKIEGDSYGFRGNIDLRQLLSVVPPEYRAGLPLDSTTMGCPFDVRLQYRQPYRYNAVGEVDDVDLSRQPMIRWLEAVQLQANDRMLDAAYGDWIGVRVPCFKIDPSSNPNPGVTQ